VTTPQTLTIIPTFWTKPDSDGSRRTRERTRRDTGSSSGGEAFYTHPTPLDEENPPLLRMLESLRRVRDLGRIAILVYAANSSLEVRADERVRELVRDFEDLDIFVVGPSERGSLYRRLEQLDMGFLVPALKQPGYGSARNLGLIAAAAMNADVAVMLDDNEVIENANFLETALYGMGETFEDGTPLLGKTGYCVDERGRWECEVTEDFTDIFWPRASTFNDAMRRMLKAPRLQQARMACGGIMALHHDLYTRVAFDPWIRRGEDTDYVINARMHGYSIFSDDEWSIVKPTRAVSEHALLFKQDAERFVYKHRKIEFTKSQVDLRQVDPKALNPFPGTFIDSGIGWRAFATGCLKLIKSKDRIGYFNAGRTALTSAAKYAAENCANYCTFQRAWAQLMAVVGEDVTFEPLLFDDGDGDRAALTGQFRAITRTH